MTWLQQLKMASFRDVQFWVDSVEVQAGDNTVLREYPFQDLPTVFRMGDGVEEIKFSAYVIGEDYIERRDALREVLTGEGVLVHPTAGAVRVFVVGKYSIKEAPTAEGGLARFDLCFVRAEPRRYPRGEPNTLQKVEDAAAAAKKAAEDHFAANWTLQQKVGWVADGAVARVKESIGVVWSTLASATQGLTEIRDTVLGNYQVLVTGINDLVAAPRLLADAVLNLFTLPSDLTQGAANELSGAFAWAFNMGERLPRKPFEAVVMPAPGAGLVMYGTGRLDAAPASPHQAAAAALAAASDRLFETAATAAWAQVAARTELGNYDQAMAMRQAVHAQCMRLLRAASAAGPDQEMPASSWHAAVQALHTAVLADLQARSSDLVRLTSYTPESWQPAIYVSYRLHGTAAYAQEILDMNPHVTHPLLVPPGIPLRIVKHD